MAEYLRSIKITVEVDTNKRTETATFGSTEAAQEWIDETLESI